MVARSKLIGVIKKAAFHVQTAWSMIGIALLMIASIEGCVRWRLARRDAENGRTTLEAAYPNAEWLHDYITDMDADQVDWWPYVYWRRHPFEGKYYRVGQDGLRKTWNAPNADEKAPRIFMFGGSTMWGTAVRADYTLPSCLSKDLAARTQAARVTNFGEGGYVSTQGLITLMLELRKGNIPDLVIFYDGLNEVATSYANGKAGLTSNEANRVKDFNADTRRTTIEKGLALLPGLRRVADRLKGPAGTGATSDPNELARLEDDTVRVYRENVRQASLLATEYGFKVLFYWQPTIFQKDALAPNEASKAAWFGYLKDIILGVHRKIAADASLRERASFHDVSEIFRSDVQPLYADGLHLTEHGNELVARRIADDVVAILKTTTK